VKSEALRHAPSAASLGQTASAGMSTQAAAGAAVAAGDDNAAGLAPDWQARMYLGCVIAAEMRAAVARETGYR
jgi:hypothetical protein